MNPDHLGDAYEITSLTAFDSLSAEAQSAWREAALLGKSSTTLFGLSGVILALAILSGILAIVVVTAIIVTPRVTVTNNCTQDIRASEIFPVVGEVTFKLAVGESRDYPIPPGIYEFQYDGENIRARAPFIGQMGPYPSSGIDAFYEGEPIMAGRPLRESIGLGDDPEIVLCPSGR